MPDSEGCRSPQTNESPKPIWTPLNRPQDGHPKRGAYLSKFHEGPARSFVCDLMKEYYSHGWCYGTSGGMSARSTKWRTSLAVATWRTSGADSSSSSPFIKGKGGYAPHSPQRSRR